MYVLHKLKLGTSALEEMTTAVITVIGVAKVPIVLYFCYFLTGHCQIDANNDYIDHIFRCIDAKY